MPLFASICFIIMAIATLVESVSFWRKGIKAGSIVFFMFSIIIVFLILYTNEWLSIPEFVKEAGRILNTPTNDVFRKIFK